MTNAGKRNLVVERRSERGNIAVLAAVVLAVLVGVTALVLDASYMYNERNRMFAAADAAAKSAALEHRLAPDANLQLFAEYETTAHGYPPAPGTTITVNNPPNSGAYAGSANYVEVILSKSNNTFLGNILGIASLTPSARAVAGTSSPMNCFTALGDMHVNQAAIQADGCGVAVGGNLYGDHTLARIYGTPTPDVSVTGSCIGYCSNMGHLVTGAPKPLDPLYGQYTPPSSGACVPVPAGMTSIPPRCYTSIPSSVTTLQSGTFVVTGQVDIGNLTGNGVLLYLTGGGYLSSQKTNKSLTISAQTSGPYAGLAIWQDASDTLTWDGKNNFTVRITGAVYMPGADFDYKNSVNIVQTGCTVWVVNDWVMKNGNGNADVSGCGSTFPSAPFLGTSLAE
jgi:hypothetical protein